MIRLNIYEAKTHLSKYLACLTKGEVILLCKRNKPFAEIRSLAPERTKRRPIGLGKGEFKISKAFFDPLPSEILDGFTGKSA